MKTSRDSVSVRWARRVSASACATLLVEGLGELFDLFPGVAPDLFIATRPAQREQAVDGLGHPLRVLGLPRQEDRQEQGDLPVRDLH